MNKLRQSLRRKKQPYVPEASRPHQWQSDEESVRKGKCSFPVRYLGHMEVEESRGMHVCEEAVKKLKTELKKMKSVFQQAGKKSVKAILWVSADGLRVVDDKTKDLIVDQTIEKVSFCAPDRNYDKAFSYICRDGTTRRWICHCFMALKDSGERLSHAVGCAFAACLERKQKREKECGVTASFDASRTSFTREGSFRVTTASQQAEREETMKQLQDKKKGEPVAAGSPAVGSAAPAPGSTSPPQGAASPVDKSESNPQHAIPRRHAPLEQLVRQGSFRGFPALSQKNSPFKRQLSLRLNELPSTLQRKTAEFEVKSPVLELDSSPTNDPGSVDALCPQGNATVHKPLMDPFSTTPASSLISANVPTLPPHAPQGVGGWADVASTTTTGGPTVVSSTFHPSHRRTPSEAERWLQEVAKAARAQQPLVSVPTGVPAFPVALDAPVSLFVPPPMQPAFVPVATYPPGLTNGAPFPPASVPVVGITPSQMVANAFGSAQAAHTHQAAGAKVPSFPPAFGHSSSSPASGPPRQPNGAAVPSQPGAGGVGRGAWLPDPTPPDADRFEAQWAALESKSQPRVGPLPTNPFTTDLQKTFEIQL